MEIHIVRVFAGSLSAIGLLISVYFALVFHNILSPDSTIIPKVCRMQKSSCVSILASGEARLLGIQNFYPGMAYYGLILFWTFGWNFDDLFPGFIKVASGLTVLAGLYLTFSLLFKLKVRCVLCLTSHGINLLLFLILILYS